MTVEDSNRRVNALKAQINHYAHASGGTFVVVDSTSQLHIATLTYRCDQERHSRAHILFFDTVPNFRRQGHGSNLLRHALDIIHGERKCEFVTLFPFAFDQGMKSSLDQKALESFYFRHGFHHMSSVLPVFLVPPRASFQLIHFTCSSSWNEINFSQRSWLRLRLCSHLWRSLSL